MISSVIQINWAIIHHQFRTEVTMKLLIFFILLSNVSQAQSLDDYLWPKEDKPSIFFNNLIKYVELNCQSYIRFPTEDIGVMCQMKSILAQRHRILKDIENSKIALPEGKEWESLFLGIVNKKYDFNGDAITYYKVTDFLVNQMALKKAIEATGRVFDGWNSSPYFDRVMYPAFIASLDGASKFIYTLRYVTGSACADDEQVCAPFMKELTADILSHLKYMSEATMNEIMLTSKWSSLESYIFTRSQFQSFLKDKGQYLSDVTVSEMLNESSANSKLKKVKQEITERLEEMNKYEFSFNRDLVNATISLVEIHEMDQVLRSMQISPRPLSLEDSKTSQAKKYIQPIEKATEEIRKLITGY